MKIGLALAGGGSLGAYQVGILKYLKEKNWHFDVVTGTSVGAINGALVVTDDIEELEKLWLEISNDKIMLNGMDLNKELLTELNPDHIFKFLKTFGTLKGVKITPFKELCKKYIDPVKIQQSACEFGTICVDFPKLVEEKIDMKKIDEHLVLPFIHASSACYPVFPIEKINDKKYIDGFYKNNLPIDFCFALGADKVIAIDLGMFGTKPQNSYLIDLPNVIYLKPKINLGSFMDFRHEVIKKNIQRGYHDAQKYFKELLGSIFTFYPSSNLQLLAQKFIQYLVTNQNEENKTLMKYLNEMIKKHNYQVVDEIAYLLFVLEFMGLRYEMDDTKLYHYQDFIDLVYDLAKEEETKSVVIATKNKMRNFYQKIMKMQEEENLEKLESTNKMAKLFNIIYNLYNGKTLE